MTNDHLKAAASEHSTKTLEAMCGEDLSRYDLNSVASWAYDDFLAGAELMRSEITELERKLATAVDALQINYMCFADLISRSKAPDLYMIQDTKEALASIQAEGGGE